MLLSEHNLLKILDAQRERPTWAACMKSIGASERQAYEWRNKSIAAQNKKDFSSPFYIEWNGVADFWHCHVGRARSEQLISYEAIMRDQAANGIAEPVFGPDQKPIWKENPRYVGREDDYVMLSEGCEPGEVAWYRLEHDVDGNPVQLTKRVQIPAQLRGKVLAQDPRYKETLDVSVAHSGTVQVSKALERLASEPRPKFEELRQLALMSPTERRAKLGASAVPHNARGLVIPVDRGAPVGDNRPDDGPEIAKPANPRAYQQPLNVKVNAPTRPAYARPSHSLDQSGIGRGTPPSGGGPANAPGNVRR